TRGVPRGSDPEICPIAPRFQYGPRAAPPSRDRRRAQPALSDPDNPLEMMIAARRRASAPGGPETVLYCVLLAAFVLWIAWSISSARARPSTFCATGNS